MFPESDGKVEVLVVAVDVVGFDAMVAVVLELLLMGVRLLMDRDCPTLTSAL
jgi:hypothetical protein